MALEPKIHKKYSAVVVATDPEDGVLFAKRADTSKEAMGIVFDDLLRIMDQYQCKITLSSEMDGYGEYVTVAKYTPQDAEDEEELVYKVCHDDEEKSE